MSKLGILCAADTELEPFLPHIRQVRTTERAMLRFYEGAIGKVDVAAVYSGVCKVNAAVAAQLLIDRFHVAAVINAGTAGGVDPGVRLFDTVVSEQAAYHDVSADILTEFHPWLESVFFPADPGLLAAAREYGGRAGRALLFGRTVTGEQFVEDAQRAELNRRFAPLSVDMETAAAAHVCHVNQIPFLSVRTVTDTAAHEGMENFEQNCETASAISAEVVLAMLDAVHTELERRQRL